MNKRREHRTVCLFYVFFCVFISNRRKTRGARTTEYGIGTRSDAFGRMTLTMYTTNTLRFHTGRLARRSSSVDEGTRREFYRVALARTARFSRRRRSIFPTTTTTTAKTAATGRLPRPNEDARSPPPPPHPTSHAVLPPSAPPPQPPPRERVREGGRAGYWLSRPTRNTGATYNVVGPRDARLRVERVRVRRRRYWFLSRLFSPTTLAESIIRPRVCVGGCTQCSESRRNIVNRYEYKRKHAEIAGSTGDTWKNHVRQTSGDSRRIPLSVILTGGEKHRGTLYKCTRDGNVCGSGGARINSIPRGGGEAFSTNLLHILLCSSSRIIDDFTVVAQSSFVILQNRPKITVWTCWKCLEHSRCSSDLFLILHEISTFSCQRQRKTYLSQSFWKLTNNKYSYWLIGVGTQQHTIQKLQNKQCFYK